MRKVLILYTKEYSGHHKAAAALTHAFLRRHPEAEVRCMRVEKFLKPWVAALFGWLYMFTIRRIPGLWEWIYDNEQIKRWMTSVKGWNIFLACRPLYRLLRRWRPDLVVCTQAVPCEGVAILKKRRRLLAPLVAVPTDFHVHAYWLSDKVDHYCVASEKSAANLIARGVDASRVTVTGIPIADAFRQPVEAASVRLRLGLDSSRPVVLLMGGGRGLIPFHRILRGLLRLPRPVQVIPVLGAGKRNRIVRWQAHRHGESVRILEYVDNIHELMEVADVIVSKPGGMTSSEILAKRLPFVMVSPLPGQEKRNQVYLTAEHAALLALDSRDVARKVDAILSSPQVAQRLRAACDRLRHPDAADRVVDAAEALLRNAPQTESARASA